MLQAHTLGLVDDIGLQRVVDSACNDLRWARARYASQTSINWDRVIQQLNKDIIAANDFLPDDKQVDTHAHFTSAAQCCSCCCLLSDPGALCGHARTARHGWSCYVLPVMRVPVPSKLHDWFWGMAQDLQHSMRHLNHCLGSAAQTPSIDFAAGHAGGSCR